MLFYVLFFNENDRIPFVNSLSILQNEIFIKKEEVEEVNLVIFKFPLTNQEAPSQYTQQTILLFNRVSSIYSLKSL